MDYKKKYEECLEKAKKIKEENPELWNSPSCIIRDFFPELGEDYFTNEFIEEFTDGDYEDMMENCKKYSCLKPLNQMLNDYYVWLCENVD